MAFVVAAGTQGVVQHGGWKFSTRVQSVRILFPWPGGVLAGGSLQVLSQRASSSDGLPYADEQVCGVSGAGARGTRSHVNHGAA